MSQDWDEVEALRASLSEHMAEIHRLRAAGRQALEALQFCLPLIEDYGDKEQLAIHYRALSELTEYAMQRLTDVQQKMERNADPGKTSDVPETNFGIMAQAVDSTKVDHIRAAEKMGEPVAYVTGYLDGKCVIRPLEHVVFPTGMALYRSPPKREPLTDEEINELELPPSGTATIRDMVRIIERAHGIGDEE